MKNKGLIITLIVIFSIICLSLISLMTGIMNGNINFSGFHFNYRVSNTLVYDEVHDNIFSTLNIDSDASDIYIKKSDNDKVRVVIYGDKDRTEVKTDDSELYIKAEAKKCYGLCFNNTISKVEVYLPASYEKDIIINNKFGDIELNSFEKANVNIKANYGDISTGTINNINIDADYGNVDIDTVNEVIIDSNYGDVNIKKVLSYLDVNCDYGDINIKNVILSKDSKIDNSLGNVKIGSTNEIYIDAKTSLGDTKINNNYRMANITLKIKNSCGDIKVNN